MNRNAPFLFDHALLHKRAQRAATQAMNNPFLGTIAEDLHTRLNPVRRDFADALNLFPPGPQIGEALKANVKIGTLRTITLQERPDPEDLQLGEENFDLIISCLGLQFANDLPGVLAQLQTALKPGGMLLGCLMGGETLKELREVFAAAEAEILGGLTAHIHPHIEVRQMGALMQRAKFAEPIIDIEKHELAYETSLALLRDLHLWSVGNLLVERSRRFLSRALLQRADEIYRQKSDSEKIRARFDIIWFSGWVA